MSLIPITFDRDICNGCNLCVEVCQVDIMIPNQEKGEPPIVVYPDECWYCGCCVEACPLSGAIHMRTPMLDRIVWKTKTGGF